ncbi:gp673 [Bacillus phage G]|uniref:Gp673 n=1 Tax=Bacillus phage G TaxID=2884420 RepID=G3MB53_9CAUD|nr:gp673 [Bacillus phage G]AEO93916.1 gp673 [Bacillus phage G]
MSFSRNDKFNADRNFVRVRFGKGKVLLESELNEMQKILTQQIRNSNKIIFEDGFVGIQHVKYENAIFRFLVDYYIQDGLIYPLGTEMVLNISNTKTEYDIYFEAQELTVSYADKIPNKGNLNMNELISISDILDVEVEIEDKETSRRVQWQYKLVLVAKGTNYTGNGKLIANISSNGVLTTIVEESKNAIQTIYDDHLVPLQNGYENLREKVDSQGITVTSLQDKVNVIETTSVRSVNNSFPNVDGDITIGIPTNTSELNNDSEFTTSSFVDTKVEEVKDFVKTEIDAKNYIINPNKWKGASVSVFGTYTFDSIYQSVKDLNVNILTIPVNVEAVSLTDSEPKINQAQFTKVKDVVARLLEKGIRVILEPFPLIGEGKLVETEWNPSDPNLWFTHWGNALKELAQYSQENNLEALYIASNFTHMEQHITKWESLISDVRAIYNGKILYRTSWWITASWAPETVTAYQAKLNNPIYGLVDVISIAAYFELTDNSDASVDDLIANIYSVSLFGRGQNVFQEIKNFNDKWNKPIFFGELGIAPYKTAYSQPWQFQFDGALYDEKIQSRWFDAFYQVFHKEDWFKGFSIFAVDDETSEYKIRQNNVSQLALYDFNKNNENPFKNYIDSELKRKVDNSQLEEYKKKLDDAEYTISKLGYVPPSRKGRLVTDFSKFVLWYGIVAQDTEHVIVGPSSVKVTTDTANTTAAARLRSTKYNFSKAKNMTIRFYVEDINKLSNIELRLSSVDNMTSYLSWKTTKWKVVNGWNEVMIPLSKLTATGGELITNTITTIQISVTGDHTSVIFDSIFVNRKSNANVMFQFDDGWLSVYTNAFPEMRSRGMVGNVGVISNSVGTNNYITLNQFKELQNYGWEMFNHTVTHRDLSLLTEEEIRTELNGCRDWLIANGFKTAANFVAYPYGNSNDAVFEVMKDFEFGRTVREEYEVLPPINPHRLKCFTFDNAIDVSVATNAIDHAIECGDTVIFLFHKIEANTNTETINYPIDKFIQILDYIYDKLDKIDVITCSEFANIR